MSNRHIDPFMKYESDFVDLVRDSDKYIRNDGFWDELNRGNKVVFITLGLLAFFFSIIMQTLFGIV